MEQRARVSLLEGWKSAWGEFPEAVQPEFDDSNWREVEIPHNWEDYQGYHRVSHGNLHGTAWYRRWFVIPRELRAEGRHFFLEFEGAGSYAQVWVDGESIGGHKGGRTCFSLDMTEALSTQEEHLLAVRTSHPERIRDLPWVCGGCFGTPNTEGSQPVGLFRPVHWISCQQVRLVPFGVGVAVIQANPKQALLHIQAELQNLEKESARVMLCHKIQDPLGAQVACFQQEVTLVPGEQLSTPQLSWEPRQPILWSTEHPQLYTIHSQVWRGGLLDECWNTFGIRVIEWENFDTAPDEVLDETRLMEEPSQENHHFTGYTRGSEHSRVAIAEEGVKIWIPECSEEAASLRIDTIVVNQDCIPHTVQLESFVQTYNMTKSIASLTARLQLASGERRLVQQECGPIQFPDFWSPKYPCLHNVVSTVRGVDEDLREYCQTHTPFGIFQTEGLANRQYPYTRQAQQGSPERSRFLLNGEHVFLNGTCEYEHELGHDHAFTPETIRARMRMLQDAGFCALREAHCPHNLRYLEECDRRGILYWAQMGAHLYFDTEEFRENFRQLTMEWVRERRNSPSVILWGIQNESMLPTEFTDEIRKLIRSLDETASTQRKVVTCNGGSGSDWNVPQNWSGTYGRRVEDYAEEAVAMRLVGEYGQYRVLGKHEEGDPSLRQNSGGDVSEELFAYCLETKVREAERIREQFYGHFQWIFMTHANPGRETLYCLDGQGSNGVGVVNSKGLFSSWGEPTDAYYMYRSNYVSAEREPMVHLVSHTWPDRFASTGRKTKQQEEPAEISVYTNCEEVELFSDYGWHSLGRKQRGAIGIHPVFSRVRVDSAVLTVVGYWKGQPAAIDRIWLEGLPEPENRVTEEIRCLEQKLWKKQNNQNDQINQECILPVSEKQAADTWRAECLYRVNCGGEDYLDHEGNLWLADRPWKPGEWGWKSWGMEYENVEDEIGSVRFRRDLIRGTSDPLLYQSFRYGREKLRYRFPVEPGRYRVTLYFQEPWYGLAGEEAEGYRLFDLAINGKRICENLDIWREAGVHRALKKQWTIAIDSADLEISFPRVRSGQAVISAVKVERGVGSE